jgi:hypothetical protein
MKTAKQIYERVRELQEVGMGDRGNFLDFGCSATAKKRAEQLTSEYKIKCHSEGKRLIIDELT